MANLLVEHIGPGKRQARYHPPAQYPTSRTRAMTLLQMLISAGKRGGSGQFGPARLSRALSITCWGQSISRDELFTYTNGRFLVNEARACNRRFLRFNVDQLCSVAASVGGPLSPIQAIEKFEGGFSKALLMRKEDGQEVIAKLPFSIAGPKKYTTASEVAVLHYCKRITITCLYRD